uniref:BED-type domain-containing protein n=1 Tax=Trichuris muris TaxID=70415 RepID=A0A5S6QGF6_TRIMR
MCLICEKVLSNEAMKPSRMLDHLSRQHPEKADKDVSHFQALREKRTNHPRISMLIAKTGYAHTIGEELLIPSEYTPMDIPLAPTQIIPSSPETSNDPSTRTTSPQYKSKRAPVKGLDSVA